jgi:hypothetical protein
METPLFVTIISSIGALRGSSQLGLYATSEAGSFVTGQMIVADGGVTIAGERG